MSKKQQKKQKADEKQQEITNDFSNSILDEPLTIALVLRGTAEDIQELKTYLEQSDLQLIYKTVSYGKLYIIDKKEEEK